MRVVIARVYFEGYRHHSRLVENSIRRPRSKMDGSHPLRALLQLHLASDSSAVLHLPHIISSLTEDCFSPSPHLSKWTTRVTSLLHSKDPGARWAGLCLAYHTAVLSRDILIEHAQGWIGVALPLLSVCLYFPTNLSSLLIYKLLCKEKRAPTIFEGFRSTFDCNL